ncbi:hypothetical protein Unana1_01546 [Umbelopsis nana]
MSDSTVVGESYRWRNEGSPVLPPVTSLYPDHEPETFQSDHARAWSISSQNPTYSNAPSWTSPKDIENNEHLDHRTRKRNREEVGDPHPQTRTKRTWSELNRYIASDAYGLHDSDVDTILDCAADISGTLGQRPPGGHDRNPRHISPISSPVEPSADGRSRSDSRGSFSDLQAHDLDRLVNKASQVVDIFEKAKKRIATSSGPSTPLPTISLSGNDLDQARSQVETMDELAEISLQRRAIAMAGARSKPDLGTSSISMFRYADNSKKKYKRAGTEKLQCHSCKSTETPEWRKGPMGPRTLCNACGLIWAKLARKKNQSSDRFKLSKDSAPSCKLEYDSTPVAITDPEPKRQQPEPMAYSNSSSQGSLEAIASGPPSRKNSDSDLLQYSLVETDFCRQNTHHSRTGGSRGDKFKLSFLLD